MSQLNMLHYQAHLVHMLLFTTCFFVYTEKSLSSNITRKQSGAGEVVSHTLSIKKTNYLRKEVKKWIAKTYQAYALDDLAKVKEIAYYSQDRKYVNYS